MAHSPQDVYARHLVSRRGYPLWTPEPNMNLPDVYVREGLKIGDVGVVVPEDGSFDVFFNLCLPSTHSLHRESGVPNNFSPILLSGRDIAKFPEAEGAGRIISTSTVARVRNTDGSDEDSERRTQPGPLNYKFTLSSREGAVLILPEGAERYYLRNERLFLDEAIKHAVDWYAFAEQRLGRIISHDSLYLITGFYKARSWSLAAYQWGVGTSEGSAQFKAMQVGGGNVAASYSWETTQAMDWRVGPADQYYYGIPNQTVFIHGFKIAVRPGILGKKRVNVKADFPSVRPYHIDLSSKPWLSNIRTSGYGNRGSVTSTFNAPKGAGTSTNLGMDMDAIESNSGDETENVCEDITISRFPQTSNLKPFHPSDSINQYLLREVPSASVAVTHDGQWSTLLEKGLLKLEELPQEDRLLKVISSHYALKSHKDTVYLQSITMDNTVDNSTITPSMSLERHLKLPSSVPRPLQGFKKKKLDVPAQATVTHPPMGHPDQVSLNELADRHFIRYKQLGNMLNLNEAITLTRQVLSLEHRPYSREKKDGHRDRATSSRNLSVYLLVRYERLGHMEDLNGAIVLSRNALGLTHADLSASLSNLAAHLSIRYKRIGDVRDLNEAIAKSREALKVRLFGRVDRSLLLSNLAVSLVMRYQHLGDVGDLGEAIGLGQIALELRPPGHADRPVSLSNLAAHLSIRYKQLRKPEDLDKAIDLSRDALALCPLGHSDRSLPLNGLADHLHARYERLNDIDDLNEAIVLGRDALVLLPPGHLGWSTSLENLARYLLTRFRCLGRSEDKEESFGLYAKLAHVSQPMSPGDLSATGAWIRTAEEYQHHTTTLAYETYLRLVIHHLSILPSLPQRFTALKSLASSLAIDAFSACLRNCSPTKAVELLEQGRGVLLSQLADLRALPDDVIASDKAGDLLVEKFTQLTMRIRSALNPLSAGQHSDQICSLNVELQKVVAKIRDLPGLSGFLLPLSFSDLKQAACGGPVIIVNASKYGCDALVVSVDHDPVHIPLSITKADVRELSSRLSHLTVRAGKVEATKELYICLRELWHEVVSPIVDFLQTVHPSRSRIWWCPTAEFSLLPLHAAGPFKKGKQNLANLYISSYTTTLAALTHARRPTRSRLATMGKRFVAIDAVNAVCKNELLPVGAELANIAQRVDGLSTFTRVEGAEAGVTRVTEELGKNEWVHLACHGIPNQEQPFESAFALYDGHLTIKHIIQCEPENPEFAYLSADYTTVGDKECPDETIHLASAMMFCGFRSVIGTMWLIDDDKTNKTVSMFYDNMKDESGHLDHTHAAFALHKTIENLKDIPFEQRIPYVHFGA